MSAVVEQIMGMPIVVEVRDDAVTAGDLEPMFDWLRRVDETFSTYRDDSEISRLDRGELELADAEPDVRWVFERCEQLRRETNGFFDARASGRLDPSGLVKGWAVDRAVDVLRAAELESFALSAGGDMRVVGGPWRVGIEHPLERQGVAAVIEANDLAIATSAAYARGDHVLDPHTGRAPADVLSVTVVGPGLAAADAYATAAFAMGARGARWTATLDGYEALTILADETVLTTAGFPGV